MLCIWGGRCWACVNHSMESRKRTCSYQARPRRSSWKIHWRPWNAHRGGKSSLLMVILVLSTKKIRLLLMSLLECLQSTPLSTVSLVRYWSVCVCVGGGGFIFWYLHFDISVILLFLFCCDEWTMSIFCQNGVLFVEVNLLGEEKSSGF